MGSVSGRRVADPSLYKGYSHFSDDVNEEHTDDGSLSAHMPRNFSEKNIQHVLREVMPAAIKHADVEVVKACEELLASHGYAVPNHLSGKWKPLVHPRNEMQLREMYAHRMPEFGYQIVASGDEFPDWLLLSDDGAFVYAEVEHRSGHFAVHHHDPATCDLIVCWEHNARNVQVDVLELLTGKLYRADDPVPKVDKSWLPVNGSGYLLISRPTTVRRNNDTGRMRSGKRDVVLAVIQATAKGKSTTEAIKQVALDKGYAESTVTSYYSRHKHEVFAELSTGQ